MANHGIQTRHLWLPNHGEVNTFIYVKVLTALHESQRFKGTFTKKKKNADY